jgi:hypothetical protein
MSNVRALSFIRSLARGHGPPQWFWPASLPPRSNAIRSLPMEQAHGSCHAQEQATGSGTVGALVSLARTRVSPYIEHHAKNLAACEATQ